MALEWSVFMALFYGTNCLRKFRKALLLLPSKLNWKSILSVATKAILTSQVTILITETPPEPIMWAIPTTTTESSTGTETESTTGQTLATTKDWTVLLGQDGNNNKSISSLELTPETYEGLWCFFICSLRFSLILVEMVYMQYTYTNYSLHFPPSLFSSLFLSCHVM